ncbi:hypothetical protein CQW23_04234 [Capsicum baccatum]|uniref:F-box domain-containing protein n=1 Tax=Capsicum baccatum TaxID=33114 RepID=A0A2G2XE29_CAPBA|nr:hypothetical protein CQW23_04234 [Capsicum baccatum]
MVKPSVLKSKVVTPYKVKGPSHVETQKEELPVLTQQAFNKRPSQDETDSSHGDRCWKKVKPSLAKKDNSNSHVEILASSSKTLPAIKKIGVRRRSMGSSSQAIHYPVAITGVGNIDALNRVLADLCTRSNPKDHEAKVDYVSQLSDVDEAKVDYVSQLSDVDEAKVDYTSQLPDDVLSSILSRMTIKDAVKTNILSTRWRYLVTHFPTKMQIFRNLRMLVLLFESTYNFDIVKVSPVLDACPVHQSLQILGSGMMAEDNSDELASPVTSVKNDSMAEDNIDELVSPITSVKNNSAGSKTRRQSTGKLNAPDSGQDVIPHYLRASTGSCRDFCKYGRKYFSEAKPWHPLSKIKNKLPADEQSPAWTLVGEAKKGTLVKQKLSTPPRSVLGEKKKVTGVEQKPSTSSRSMLGEAKKRTVVMQKTSTTSGSNQSDEKKGILVKQKLSTPPVNMLEE